MKRVLLSVVVFALAAGVGYGGWLAYAAVERRASSPFAWQGYVEGEFVQVSAPVPGRLDTMAVKRGDRVKAGDALFELESAYERAALRAAMADRDSAEAQLADMRTGKRPPEIAALEAQLEQARAVERDSSVQLKRDLELYRRDAIPKSQLDNSQSLEDANAARVRELTDNIAIARLPDREMQIKAQAAVVRSAVARVEQAEWTLSRKQIASTRDGLVYDVVFRVGEWVPAGQPVVRMLPPENVKIRFYVPEAALSSLRVGQALRVGRDGAEPVPATITYISAEAEFTPPVIYSNESRYKLSFMVEAHTAPEVAATLSPGQPVQVGLR